MSEGVAEEAITEFRLKHSAERVWSTAAGPMRADEAISRANHLGCTGLEPVT